MDSQWSLPDIWLIHLYGQQLESLDEARDFVKQARAQDSSYLFSADVEWGWVNHIQVSQDELSEYGLPEEFFTMRRDELSSYSHLDEWEIEKILLSHPLPTQEWLWRVYSWINSEQERKDFLLLMKSYGKTMAKICDYIWINIMFWPVLDRVEDIDWERPMEKQDRSYGDDYNIIRDLAVAYLAWVKEVEWVISVPKHFIGNGASANDPHYNRSNSRISHTKWTAILPFRDIINFSNNQNPQAKRYEWYITKLQEANKGHRARQDVATSQAKRDEIQVSIDANNRLLEKNNEELAKTSLGYLQSLFTDGIDLPLIMVSNVWTNLYNDPETPTMFSSSALDSLSRPKGRDWLWFEWITITDDIRMESSMAHIEWQRWYFSWYDLDALAVYTAIWKWNEIALMRYINGNEKEIASEVARYIEEWVDLNEDGVPDLTEESLNKAIGRVLDLKTELWVMSKVKIRWEDYYVLDPQQYNPTEGKVLRDSFFSNQWPWLDYDKYYEDVWRDNDQGNLKLFAKAFKNFGTTLYSTTLNWFAWGLWNERYESAESNPKELVIVDKSARYLWRYDFETRELIEMFEIWIWKWGEWPRRVVWDHRTPTWYYQIVMKRDAEWWKENKWVDFPEYYWGEGGWMLVMTWQWTPEIAIHWWWGLWHVSNACIRVDDPTIQKLMRDIPNRSMVIITN